MAANTLRCRECGATYPAEPIYVCARCFGPLEVLYDYDALAARSLRSIFASGPRSIWRYEALLPVARIPDIDLQPGYSPLVPAYRLGRELGLRHLYIKNDSINPTWSFKDRVVAVAAAAARHFGFEVLACASTGNLANAVAAQAARAGMRSYVFIPKGLERGKVLTAAAYHPTLVEVDGTYDQVNRLCAEIADEYRWAFVNVNLRPYYAEGGKTLGFEVAEQLGWRAPDHVVVPVASGSLLVKVHKGLTELERTGVIPSARTRMHGAQAAGCGPVATAFVAGADEVTPVKPHTIAQSLAIGAPADGRYVLRLARETQGSVRAVSDEEIVQSIHLLAQTEGIFTEPAGGVTVGALQQLAGSGVVKPDEVVVAYITGIGLKTLEAVEPGIEAPIRIPPTLREFEQQVMQPVR